MENNLSQNTYNPDVLSCIANLSNDEVFTPPELANKMIDMLPQELFENPDTTFLDPCCKSGVFLREIAKRLIRGLEPQMPDLEKRVEHIFSKQLYGIAITELTSLLSRRSLYCSKFPSSGWSAYQFPESKPQGNVIYQRIQHTWKEGKCLYCGASQSEYDRGEELETHAYQFIHNFDVKKLCNMKFDVIIGNPPYQLEIGIEKENYSIPLYHKFIQQAKKLAPRYISMIVPSRWFAGGRGLDEFRDEMLKDRRIKKIVDYPNAVDCFPGVDISGGVCYFLWSRDYNGDCEVVSIQGKRYESTMIRPLLEKNNDTFIRFNEAITIIRKITACSEKTFDSLVSPQTPFGIVSSFKDYSEEQKDNSISIYTVKGKKYIDRSVVVKNQHWIDTYKVYISKSYGERGAYPYRFLAKPFVGEPNSCCTQTYLMIGGFESKDVCENVIKYIHTKFFRFCVMLKKNTQDAMRGVYSFVPIQDFSEEWTDEKLYAKYNLTEEEVAFIESMIRPME
jgi:site-specific DNA-methyltransferase (adenine-specific)